MISGFQELIKNRGAHWEKEMETKADAIFAEMAEGNICKMAEKEKDRFSKVLKELSRKHEGMIPIRKRVTKCLISATDPKTTIQLLETGWLAWCFS